MDFRVYYIVFAIFVFPTTVLSRSFQIDFDNDRFVKDGQPYRYVSGSIHYFRVPYQLWEDRLQTMRAAGVNAVQTYIEWSQHEPENGQYSFENQTDFVNFLKIAQKVGLDVILRLGPFIDAERDFGGFPYWLLGVDPDIKLRTFDSTYLKYVDRWYSVLLPKVKPLLYANGGPIIMVQVENEYGSYGACDFKYTTHLRDLFWNSLGKDTVLFTTDGDGDSYLTCGKIEDVYATVDFGSGTNVTEAFAVQKRHQSKGPNVNSEYYTGWLDHWNYPHAQVATDSVIKTLKEMLDTGASVNFYMFHGGTSFGFGAGSNDGNTIQVCPTSYDYDAPINEAGDPTDKYFALRTVISSYLPLPSGPVPKPKPKMEFGPLEVYGDASLFAIVKSMVKPVTSAKPLSFEDLDQDFGFVIYETVVPTLVTDPVVLNAPGIADRGYVYVGGRFSGIVSREVGVKSLPVRGFVGEKITILVENQGRICVGQGMHDRKGIIQDVTLGSHNLTNWNMYRVPLGQKNFIQSVPKYLKEDEDWEGFVPTVFSRRFTFQEGELLDTFLSLEGWNKGVVFINGHNLGKYWPIVGPQKTLYVPSVFLNPYPQDNLILILELEGAPARNCQNGECTVSFVKEHVINATTPF